MRGGFYLHRVGSLITTNTSNDIKADLTVCVFVVQRAAQVSPGVDCIRKEAAQLLVLQEVRSRANIVCALQSSHSCRREETPASEPKGTLRPAPVRLLSQFRDR